MSRASGYGFEITVESNIAVGKEILPQLKEIISKRENQKNARPIKNRISSLSKRLFFFVIFSVMLAEKIASKVIFEITPNQMRVVGIVLGVGVFNQEIRSLNSEIMRLAVLQ